MNRTWKRFQEKFEEDPEKVLFAVAAVLGSTAMCMRAYSDLKGRRVWAQEVARRDRISRY